MKKTKNYQSSLVSFSLTHFDLYDGDKFVEGYTVEGGKEEAKRLREKGYIDRDSYKAMILLPPVKKREIPKDLVVDVEVAEDGSVKWESKNKVDIDTPMEVDNV